MSAERVQFHRLSHQRVQTVKALAHVAGPSRTDTIDNFAHIFDRKPEELVIGRMDRNSDFVVQFLDKPEVRELVTSLMRIWQDATSRGTEA